MDGAGAMLSLLLGGDLEAGLPLVFRANKDTAFSYETVELPEKAVKVFDYGGTEEEKGNGWPSDTGSSGRLVGVGETLRVLTIASFLYTRGERPEALRIMKDLSEIAWGEGRSNWLEFIGRLNDLGGACMNWRSISLPRNSIPMPRNGTNSGSCPIFSGRAIPRPGSGDFCQGLKRIMRSG